MLGCSGGYLFNLIDVLLSFYNSPSFVLLPVLMASGKSSQKRAWVTLLTRASYLPGVITLAHSLSVYSTQYPLIVLVTPSLPQSSLHALELESKYNRLLIVHPIKPLLPPANQKTTLIATRFEDTWTKLRAFELTSYGTCVFLDADITVYHNMDEVFDIELPGRDWIAANHACVCNLDHDSWAPENWKRENCAWTPLRHPSSMISATPVPRSATPPDTYALLNGGLFLYHPSQSLWDELHNHFLNSKELPTYQFPDQDFLASFFLSKWQPLPWKYNALKTMRAWHPNIWRDAKVMGLHYIVDKPWEKRVASDGIGGHLGRDGETHKWWWGVWDDWRRGREGELVHMMDELVAKPLDEDGDRRQCKENEEKGFPVPVSSVATEDGTGGEGVDVEKAVNGHTSKNGADGSGLDFPVLRKPRLGEQGNAVFNLVVQTFLSFLYSVFSSENPQADIVQVMGRLCELELQGRALY